MKSISEQNLFVSLSFATIAASGPNGSIIHYHPNPESCSLVLRDRLFLLDSGAQYRYLSFNFVFQRRKEEEECLSYPFFFFFFDHLASRDGTTDVTRTVHFGEPSEYQKKCFTLVLKGVIALNTAVFPEGTTGRDLDVLARLSLWSHGLDYRHGTGHGVGAFLNVHEGPQGISSRPQAGRVAFQPGMTITDGFLFHLFIVVVVVCHS